MTNKAVKNDTNLGISENEKHWTKAVLMANNPYSELYRTLLGKHFPEDMRKLFYIICARHGCINFLEILRIKYSDDIFDEQLFKISAFHGRLNAFKFFKGKNSLSRFNVRECTRLATIGHAHALEHSHDPEPNPLLILVPSADVSQYQAVLTYLENKCVVCCTDTLNQTPCKTRYCNKECQKKEWQLHTKTCVVCNKKN